MFDIFNRKRVKQLENQYQDNMGEIRVLRRKIASLEQTIRQQEATLIFINDMNKQVTKPARKSAPKRKTPSNVAAISPSRKSNDSSSVNNSNDATNLLLISASTNTGYSSFNSSRGCGSSSSYDSGSSSSSDSGGSCGSD
jgi:TolA-binding protein